MATATTTPGAAPGSHPPAYRPQLPVLVVTPPRGPGWIHELKLDGYRIGVELDGGRVRLLTRQGLDWTAEFPAVARAARALPARRALLDGEVVALVERGRSSFQALQNRGRAPVELRYFAFDLLALDGQDLAALPLLARKARLRALLGDRRGLLQYVDHFEDPGAQVLRHACALAAEGIVSKRRDAPARPGARHPDWQKVKCARRQELVVGGFTEPGAARAGVGALLLGYHEDGRLRFAGKVSRGEGWGQAFGRALRARLAPLARSRCPFDPPPPGWLGRSARWVDPVLVCEVEFAEWTASGQVRHPTLRGFRADKPAAEVVRERATVPASPAPRAAQRRRAVRAPPPARAASTASTAARLEGATLHDPGALVYPAAGLSKLDLARFFAEVWPWAEPHLAGRPLTVVRRRGPIATPDALRTVCRFVRHTPEANAFAGDAVPRLRIQEQRKLGEYLWIDGLRALLALVDGDVVELHAWNARVDDPERPDRLVLDLDPGDDVPWPRVAEAAWDVRERLEALGLASWPKATGGKGVHVVAPLARGPGWDEVFAFSRAFAAALARDAPAAYTVSFAKRDRGGRVLLDYKRNYRTSIAVAPFSTRARPDAPVAVPLAWDEVSASRPPGPFTVATVPARLRARRADPRAGAEHVDQRLPAGEAWPR